MTLLQQTLAANDADVEEEGVGAQNAVGAAGVSFDFAKSLLRVSSLQICLDFLCLIGKTEREHGEYVWG